jgi:Lhr-like helicase
MALGTRRDGGVEIGSGLALDVHVPSDDLFVDRGEPVLLVNLESPQGVSHGGRLGRRGSRAGGGLG